ncbi:MAG: ABC transporter ATP-binding protein [Proteobacteria bacterium]|nr:ABC transporter ATP-binding protein [Pseudomonadota bacterium]
MTHLEIIDLHKDFSGLHVISGVSLKIAPGERHAVIGPNGAGKSTLFNLISGRYRPNKGRILFKGEDITGWSPLKINRRGLARSFQITNIFKNMTVLQNIENAILARKGMQFKMFRLLKNMPEVPDEARSIMETISVAEHADAPAGELSYGLQRALEIGIALATGPNLLLLDEPTAGMTKEETREAVTLIEKITEGKTLIIIEHDMDVVFSLADQITVLNYGEILASGTPQDIKNNPDVKRAYLGNKICF